MNWSESFYTRQAEVPGIYTSAIYPFTTTLAARVTAHLGGPRRVLELGSGAGQFAVAAALLGHDVTALERVPLLVEHTHALSETHGVQPTVKQADFYTIQLPAAHYHAVCYWDGFGIGSDEDQRRLLRRGAGWPQTAGCIWTFTRRGTGQKPPETRHRCLASAVNTVSTPTAAGCSIRMFQTTAPNPSPSHCAAMAPPICACCLKERVYI